MSSESHDDHGHTPAAWTCVGVLIVASLIMSLSVVFALTWLFIVGMVVAVLGVVLGKVLQLAGYGKKVPVTAP